MHFPLHTLLMTYRLQIFMHRTFDLASIWLIQDKKLSVGNYAVPFWSTWLSVSDLEHFTWRTGQDRDELLTAQHTHGWVALENIKVCMCPCLCGCEHVAVHINLEPLFLSTGTYLYPQYFGDTQFLIFTAQSIAWFSLHLCLWWFIYHKVAMPACTCFSVSPRSPVTSVGFPQGRQTPVCFPLLYHSASLD